MERKAYPTVSLNKTVKGYGRGEAGGVAAMLFSWSVSAKRKPDVRLSVNGMLAGLAAIISLAAARWLPVSVAPIGSLDPRARPELTPPSVPIHPASGPIVVAICVTSSSRMPSSGGLVTWAKSCLK